MLVIQESSSTTTHCQQGHEWIARQAYSCFRRTWAASLELAFLALEDEPMRPGVTHVTVPEDQRSI